MANPYLLKIKPQSVDIANVLAQIPHTDERDIVRDGFLNISPMRNNSRLDTRQLELKSQDVLLDTSSLLPGRTDQAGDSTVDTMDSDDNNFANHRGGLQGSLKLTESSPAKLSHRAPCAIGEYNDH